MTVQIAPSIRHEPAYALPPRLRKADGTPRRVGVEVEFGRLSAAAAADALVAALGGTVTAEDPHAFHIVGTDIGDLVVELDLRLSHPARHPGTPQGRLSPGIGALLGHAASRIVPRELVTRPLDLDRLADVDRAVRALAAAGARPVGPASYGLHFNVDPPQTDATTILAYLRAYLILAEPLRASAGPAGWFDPRPPFPPAYEALVLDPAYRPDAATLLADYVRHNPTRRRDLDLLPLLLHLDPERVRAALPTEKIGRRPVLHYRLPAAAVGEPGWSPAAAWNRWVAVERLAADPDMLAQALGDPAVRRRLAAALA